MLKKIFGLLVVVILGLVLVAAYFGAFTEVQVTESTEGPYYFVYQNYQGPYQKVSPTFNEVDQKLKKMGFVDYTWAGLFYDKPGMVADDKLRADIGAILSTKDYYSLKLPLENGLLARVLNARPYFKAVFPNKGTVSIILGVFKAYPAINKYMQDLKLPPFTYKEKEYENDYAMEIYETKNINYLMTQPKAVLAE